MVYRACKHKRELFAGKNSRDYGAASAHGQFRQSPRAAVFVIVFVGAVRALAVSNAFMVIVAP